MKKEKEKVNGSYNVNVKERSYSKGSSSSKGSPGMVWSRLF